MRGISLLEVLSALALAAVLALLAAPRLGGVLDRLATHRAASDVAAFYTRGRFAAIFRSQRVRLEFAAGSLRAVQEGSADSTLFVVPGPARHGVSLTVSRRAIRVGPNGIGWGAANTKLVLRRGAAAESLTTSRLGRLKRW